MKSKLTLTLTLHKPTGDANQLHADCDMYTKKWNIKQITNQSDKKVNILLFDNVLHDNDWVKLVNNPRKEHYFSFTLPAFL